ncbi:hypothetical protein OCE25_28970 [Bacillus cereus]|uniref:MauE/DoxX family redox-associated membrane protein n=1 Tax=Bacillus mycoides TaxID=1405 RepID=UPI001C0134C4|nr:MauE/DoxX family redox-associated membrane protein [Bacillus mycoides]MCU4716266.1 hypothetical protein [Bacillus cereus]QWH75462.1 hypothetical protein EXW59_00875 [Bacillus mycoides]
MSILYNSFYLLLIIIFLSSSLDKILNWKKHFFTAEKYKIISGIPLTIILITLVIMELIIAIIFLVQTNISLLLILLFNFLLCFYSLLILYSLLKGNSNISCGCGGLLESDKLHLGIIIRNIFIIIIGNLLFYNNFTFQNLGLEKNIISILYVIIIIFIYKISDKIRIINDFNKKLNGELKS